MEQEHQQGGTINDILYMSYQAMTGALNTAVMLAHAPEYNDSRVSIEFNVHKVPSEEEGQPVKLEFKHEIKVFLDDKYITPQEAEEIYNNNETIKSMQKQAVQAQRKMAEQADMQRKMAAVRAGAADKKIITLN